MRLRSAVLSALLTGALTSSGAYAHLGETQLMFQFPDGMTPTLDGDMSDWDIVGDAYKIQAANMFNQFSAPVDLSDFNSWIAWGYNVAENKAYLGIWFFDDMENGTEHWSVEVDWDHSGEQYRSFDQGDDYEARWINAANQKFDVAAPAQDPAGWSIGVSGKNWVSQPPYTVWGGQFISGSPDNFEPAEMFVEIAFQPYDDVYPDDESQSTKHTFHEGDIVGLEVNRGDKDADPGSYDDAYWSTFGGVNAWKFADQYGDYLLAPIDTSTPTAVESSTWGQMKSSFVSD